MKVPKIKFMPMSLEENIEAIKWAYYHKDDSLDVHWYTIQYFPELAQIDPMASREENYQQIARVVTKDYETYREKIQEEVKRYDRLWSIYNDEYFEMLSNYLKVEWPHHINVIEVKVGLIPVFPRYLDDFSFSLSTNLEESKCVNVCAHETLHFLWFEKWKKLHPETPRREYDSPYITWKYSEMVTDPILNNKPFSELFKLRERGYDSFYEVRDGDNFAMDILRSIYGENIPIEEKINKGFLYITNVLGSDKKDKKHSK